MKRFVLVVAILMLLHAPAHAAAPADRPIQPGARLTHPGMEPAGGAIPYTFLRCTLSFIFKDKKKNLYTGTTGESACVSGVKARTYDESGKAFGTAVFQEFAPPAGSFTLIRIDRSRYRDVGAAVRHWGGPTKIAKTGKAGDPILFYGHGFVEGDVAQTQGRPGVLVSYDSKHFTADSLAELGDSGAPVIDEKTGAAIGMISDFGTGDVPPTTDDGPSVIRILADLRKVGFVLTLVTAPFSSPA